MPWNISYVINMYMYVYMLCKLLLFVYILILIITAIPYSFSYLLYPFHSFLDMAPEKVIILIDEELYT